jgi:hypothetical protein
MRNVAHSSASRVVGALLGGAAAAACAKEAWMRFPRALVACALAVSLVVVAGGAQAVAAPGTGGATPSPAQPSGPLDGLTKTIGGLLGGGSGNTGSHAPTPAPSPSTHKARPHHDGSSKSGTSPVSGLPLPSPGDDLPDHLCLPGQLTSSLPSDIPTCLDLTTCKNGLVRDLERLPTVKLTELADYVQQVLGDIPACLESLLPTTSPSPSPSSTPPSTPPLPPPGSAVHEPAPAQPATPVTRQPGFTG